MRADMYFGGTRPLKERAMAIDNDPIG